MPLQRHQNQHHAGGIAACIAARGTRACCGISADAAVYAFDIRRGEIISRRAKLFVPSQCSAIAH